MRPITPARILGGRILVDAAPIAHGLAKVYRGVDLGEIVPSTSANSAASSGPYRAPPAFVAATEPEPVIVREVSANAFDDPGLTLAFARVAASRRALGGSPAPRLLHAFARDGRVQVTVEEHVRGAPLDAVLRALRDRGAEMPAAVALAVAASLVSLYLAAEAHGIAVRIEPPAILIDPRGAVRVIPEYPEERARQTVGAAIMLLSAAIAYAAPEEITGAGMDARSGIFSVGLVLHEMLAGSHPVATSEAGMFAILSTLARDDLPSIRKHCPTLHPSAVALVDRCLARDPDKRFASFRDLARALAGARSLFPPIGEPELAAFVRDRIPTRTDDAPPLTISPDVIAALPDAGYHAVPLPQRAPLPLPRARPLPALDPDAVHPMPDARPMLPISPALLVDMRPVTRAEIERFFIMSGEPRPPHLAPLHASTDDEACVHVPIDLAEAYAAWARKRLPTEAEWHAAVATLGADRLGVGEIWEWTATPHEQRGRVVRGGRWRDQPGMPVSAENRSFAVSEAADLGFRCVKDRG